MKRIAVGFDFDQTLGMDNHLERTAFGRLAEQFGVQLDVDEPKTYDAIEALLVPFRAAEELMPQMLARFVEFLPPNPQLLDVDADDLTGRYRQICYDLVDELVQPMSGASDCIKALVANGIPVGILTNGWSELQERKIERALGEFPGPVLVSEEIGAYKPSAEAFRKLETALGVDPSNLWYVGDNPTNDIAGARAYGLRAVWLNRGGQEYPAGLEPATAVIEDLAELWAIVRGT
jgi:HAD superfamily hydrolase (TIGR01549 family)